MSWQLKLSSGIRTQCSDSNSQEVKSSWREWMRALADTPASVRPGGPCWGTWLSDQAENCIKRCQGIAGPFWKASCGGLGVGRLYSKTAFHLQFAWYSTWQSDNGQGLEKSTFCKYAMGLRGFNMSAPFNHLQLTVIFLGSSSLFEDEVADLVEFYVEFHARAQLDKTNKNHPTKKPKPKAGSNPLNGFTWLILQHFDEMESMPVFWVSKKWKFVSLYCHQQVKLKPKTDT